MSNSFTPLEIKNKLLQALDEQNNIVDMKIIVDTISILEKTALTREALEQTRLGKYVNEIRKKLTSGSAPVSNQNEILQVAKRAKNLVKRWRDNLLPTNDQSLNPSIVNTNKLLVPEQLIPRCCEAYAHPVNNASIITNIASTTELNIFTSETNSIRVSIKEKGQLLDQTHSTHIPSTFFSSHSRASKLGGTALPLLVHANGILSPKSIMDDVKANCINYTADKNKPLKNYPDINLSNGSKNSTNEGLVSHYKTNDIIAKTNFETSSLKLQTLDQLSLSISTSNINSMVDVQFSNKQIELPKSVVAQVKPRKLKTTAELMAEIKAKSKVMSTVYLPQVSTTSLSPPIQPLPEVPQQISLNTRITASSAYIPISKNELEHVVKNKRKGKHKRSKASKEIPPDISTDIAHSIYPSPMSTQTSNTLENRLSTKIVQSESSTHSKPIYTTATPKLKIFLHEPPIIQVSSPPETASITHVPSITVPKTLSPTILLSTLRPQSPNSSPNDLLDTYISLFKTNPKSSPQTQFETKENCPYLQSWFGDREDRMEDKLSIEPSISIPQSYQTPYVVESLDQEDLIILPFADIEE